MNLIEAHLVFHRYRVNWHRWTPTLSERSPNSYAIRAATRGSATEFQISAHGGVYFAPANHHVIEDAKQADDSGFNVHALTIDGTEIRQINDGGDGACSIE